uniref:Toxin Tx7335 n=1 Tax=Dendroaspis angusticeps TaxID=8618 RepID=3NOJ_DENAN|nr:RecName: Full=Toxin Tx7335 [Dendroaspis angusticeps]
LECHRRGSFISDGKITCSAKKTFCCKMYEKIFGIYWYGCAKTYTEKNTWNVYSKCCTTNLCNT